MKFKLEKDKLQHLGACAGITFVIAMVCNAVGFGIFSIPIAAGITLIIGAGKEIRDGRRDDGVNDPADMKANIIGVMIGAIAAGGGMGLMSVI